MGIILACLLGQTYSSLTYNSTLSQTSTKPSLQLPVLGWSGPGWHTSSGCLHSSCSPQLCRGSGRSADHFLLRLSQAMVHRQSLPGKMKSSDRITAAPSDVLPKAAVVTVVTTSSGAVLVGPRTRGFRGVPESEKPDLGRKSYVDLLNRNAWPKFMSTDLKSYSRWETLPTSAFVGRRTMAYAWESASDFGSSNTTQ